MMYGFEFTPKSLYVLTSNYVDFEITSLDFLSWLEYNFRVFFRHNSVFREFLLKYFVFQQGHIVVLTRYFQKVENTLTERPYGLVEKTCENSRNTKLYGGKDSEIEL